MNDHGSAAHGSTDLAAEASRTRVLVRTLDGSAAAPHLPRLSELGVAEVVEGHPDTAILHLDVPASEPRAAWERIRSSLGAELAVAPVLLDRSGRERYLLGTITVRFRRTPSEAELHEFEDAWALATVARNRYVPNQITFRPADPARQYLPEVLVELSRDAARVERAWPEALSRFDRLEGR